MFGAIAVVVLAADPRAAPPAGDRDDRPTAGRWAAGLLFAASGVTLLADGLLDPDGGLLVVGVFGAAIQCWPLVATVARWWQTRRRGGER